jgi:acetamidase/formamidase
MRPPLVSRSFRLLLGLGILAGCVAPEPPPAGGHAPPAPDFVLEGAPTHNKFSRRIPAVLRVPSGSVVRLTTKEATDGQLGPASTAADVPNVQVDPIHPLTGPIAVEGAEPGDVLAVTLLAIEVGDWGWAGVFPGFGFLAGEFGEPWLRTFDLSGGRERAEFAPGISIPLRPFPGVMGVAPDTDEMLSTIPPRANGGNLDNPHLRAGTTVYFPVFVAGALFSIGDTHAAQGLGEVCGTGIEAPMTITLRLEVRKGGRRLAEPEYETADYYAVTAFGEDLDEAARRATRRMIDWLVAEKGLERAEAYALCSLAGDLQVAETVDLPHFGVAMHMPKAIFR